MFFGVSVFWSIRLSRKREGLKRRTLHPYCFWSARKSVERDAGPRTGDCMKRFELLPYKKAPISGLFLCAKPPWGALPVGFTTLQLLFHGFSCTSHKLQLPPINSNAFYYPNTKIRYVWTWCQLIVNTIWWSVAIFRILRIAYRIRPSAVLMLTPVTSAISLKLKPL